MLLAALAAFTLLAQIFMPALVLALAQGFAGDAAKFDAAVHYARIAFPYLIAMSLMSLFAAMLNATGRFFAAAFAPILLNLVLIGTMIAALAFAGAPLDYLIWGVAFAGLAQLGFVFVAARAARSRSFGLKRPRLTPEVKKSGGLPCRAYWRPALGKSTFWSARLLPQVKEGAAAGFIMLIGFINYPWGDRRCFVSGTAAALARICLKPRHKRRATRNPWRCLRRGC